jgi:hypothetical protein
VNGQVASIGPCKGTVDHWYYETVDVAHLLRRGENVIAAEVLRYAPVHRGNVSITRSYSPGFILLGESGEVRPFVVCLRIASSRITDLPWTYRRLLPRT